MYVHVHVMYALWHVQTESGLYNVFPKLLLSRMVKTFTDVMNQIGYYTKIWKWLLSVVHVIWNRIIYSVFKTFATSFEKVYIFVQWAVNSSSCIFFTDIGFEPGALLRPVSKPIIYGLGCLKVSTFKVCMVLVLVSGAKGSEFLVKTLQDLECFYHAKLEGRR